jgi:plastocyanin domain-containing protein
MDKIIVFISGIGLVGLIYWFFFGKNDKVIVAGETIDILVNGGYKPSSIKIKNGKNTKLVFTRTDPNSCLEEIVIPDFKVKEYLPLNKKVEITLSPKKAGTYQTHCGMGMFHGKIIVE